MVTKRELIFRAKDGREFADEAAAEHHEEMVTAKEAFEHARATFGRTLAATHKTADGTPFNSQGTYWRLVDSFWGMPAITQVYLMCYWGDFEWDESADGFAVVISKWDGAKNEKHRVPIKELYESKRAASEALIAQREERVAQFVAETEAMKGTLS